MYNVILILVVFNKTLKWYDEVKIVPALSDPTKYTIMLDDRYIRTASSGELLIPTMELAMLVAQDWDCQQLKLRSHTMRFV